MKKVSHPRTHNYLLQVKGSFFFKTCAVACSFLLVPLMINYLGHEKFGVWSTLLSVMTWITFLDLGLGNGLRNVLAESIAKGREDEARDYISSSYSIIGIISLVLLLLLAFAAFLVPWDRVFNTEIISSSVLSCTVLATGFFIALNFWLSLINSVLNAFQRASMVVFGQLLCNLLSLIFVYVLAYFTKASILYLCIAYGTSLVFSNVIVSVWFYKSHLNLLPTFSLDLGCIQPLLSLGLQFFVIQIAVLVIFTTDKILITQFFGPEYVTQYDVIYKLFSVITLVHSLIAAPLCSSYTDAYHREDYEWIKEMLQRQLIIFCMVIFFVVIMLLLAKKIIAIWIGSDFNVLMSLVSAIGGFVILSTWNNIFGLILGGINKIRLGSYYTILTATLNIPFCYYFAKKLGFGVSGIMLGTIASISISAIISPLQVYYFIYTKQQSKFLSSILK